MRGLIEQAQEAGTANRSVDAALLASCVFATIIWTYRWFRPRGVATAAAAADACARYAVDGVRA